MPIRNRSLVFAVVLFALVSLGLRTSGQDVEVSARLSPEKGVIGDTFQLVLELTQPAGTSVAFPIFGDSIAHLVEILNRKTPDTTQTEQGLLRIRQEYTLTSFDSGSYVLGPFPFTFTGKNGPDSSFSQSILLYVNTLPIDTAKGIVDIRPPIDTPISLKELLPFFGFGLLGLAILASGYWYYLQRKKKRPAFAFLQKPKEPAHVIALRDLDSLKEKKLWQQDRIKEYHSELSDVVRRYIEDRYQAKAMEQTTEEILGFFQSTRLIDSLQEEKLSQLLRIADLVKFAKFRPLADEHDLSMRHAYAFVLQTKESLQLLDEDPVLPPKNNSAE